MRPQLIATCLLLTLASCGGQQPQDAVPPANHTILRASVVSAQANANSSAYDDVVQKNFVAYFGRPADSGGLTYFKAQFAAAGAPTNIAALSQAYGSNAAVKALIDSFANSAESNALYPGDNSTFILAIYKNLFNRVADAGGLSYWSDLLNAGMVTRSSAAISIMSGTQGTDTTIIQNKSTVAANFTSALDTAAKAAAYSGLEANVSVRTMLGNVSDTTNVASFGNAITATLSNLLTPTSPSVNALIGTWYIDFGKTNTSLPIAITFLSDGSYLMADNGNTAAIDPSGRPGIEVGAYSYTNGIVSTTCPTIDADGQWGLSHPVPDRCTGSSGPVVISGNTATFNFNNQGNMMLTRVVDTSNALVGTWYANLGTSGAPQPIAITFLSSGTYLMADAGNTNTIDPSGQYGLEVGSYTYANGIVTTSCPIVNTDGQWGLSHPQPDICTGSKGPVTLSASGNTATFNFNNQGNMVMTRVTATAQ